jgi:putative peptide zinc metalloprotease protein
MTGVPDMFARIKPTLKSLLPWKEADASVAELKPWVRVAVTIYVLTVVPFLAFALGMMALNAPRIFATAYDSFFVQYHKVDFDLAHGRALAGGLGIFQMLLLVLPTAGIVYTFAKLGRRVGGAAWTRTDDAPLARAVLVVGATAIAAAIAYVWYPSAVYKPIQPGERGTIQGAAGQIEAIPGGRPALPKKVEQKLHGAPAKATHDLSGGSTTPSTTTPAATNQTTNGRYGSTTPTQTTATTLTQTTATTSPADTTTTPPATTTTATP